MTQEAGELQDAMGYIQATRHALEKGGEVDLRPLEMKIERFCKALHEAPPDRRETMKKRVIGLIDDLDRLAEELRGQYAELGERLSKMSRHEQALGAYGNDPVKKNPTKKK
ncbi:MAG: hypothetical protein AB1781_00315 [Pseudomonadota bacterium]